MALLSIGGALLPPSLRLRRTRATPGITQRNPKNCVQSVGNCVIIADHQSAPAHTVRPGLVFSGKTGTSPQSGFVWTPAKSPKGPVSIIISSPDRRIYVYRNGVEIGRAPVPGLEAIRISGTYVYSADTSIDSSGRRDWISVASVGKKAPNLRDLEARTSIDPAFLQDIRELVAPGTTMVLTNAPVSSQTHSGTGFGILTAAR